jgi:hypothetical protein
MLNDRENILSALREKPLKVYEIMKQNARRRSGKVRYSQRTMAHRIDPAKKWRLRQSIER